MPTFFVDSDMTEQTSNNLQSRCQDALALLSSIEAEVKNLLDNGYKTGDSSQKFDEFARKFLDSYKSTTDGLEGVAKYVKGVGDATLQMDLSLGQSLAG